MPFVLTALFAIVAWIALSVSGRLLLRSVPGGASAPGGLFLGFFVGLAFIGLAATVAAATGYATPTTLRLLALVAAIAAVAEIVPIVREQSWKMAFDRADTLFAVAVALFMVPSFIIAAAPPVTRDALVYHLPIAARTLSTGSWTPIPGDVYSFFPSLTEMAFAVGMSVAGAHAAAALHWLCGLSLAGLTYRWLKTRTQPFAAGAAALAVVSTPVAMVFGGAAYVDLFLCLAFVSSLILVETAVRQNSAALTAMAGAAAGLTVAIKYTGLWYAAILTLPLLLALRGRTAGNTVRHLSAWVCAGLAAGSLFLMRNLAAAGNPFYPFAYSIFGGPGWDLHRAASYNAFLRSFGGGWTPLDLLALPYRIAMTGQFGTPYFDGTLGPFALVFALAALAAIPVTRRDRVPIYGWTAAATLIAFAGGTHQARFALPVLVAGGAAAASGLDWLQKRDSSAKTLVIALVTAALAGNFAMGLTQIARINPFAAALGGRAAEGYEARLVPGYGVYRALRESVDPHDRVFAVLTGNFRYLSPIPFDSDTVFEDTRLQELLASANSPETVLKRFHDEGWTYFFFDAARLNNALDQETRALLAAFITRYSRVVARDRAFVLLRIVDGSE